MLPLGHVRHGGSPFSFSRLHGEEWEGVGPEPGGLNCTVARCLPLLSSAVVQPQFLPENAQVACRPILPNCFTREQWRVLCLEAASIQEAFSRDCAGAENDLLRDDASPTPSGADLSPAQ